MGSENQMNTIDFNFPVASMVKNKERTEMCDLKLRPCSLTLQTLHVWNNAAEGSGSYWFVNRSTKQKSQSDTSVFLYYIYQADFVESLATSVCYAFLFRGQGKREIVTAHF